MLCTTGTSDPTSSIRIHPVLYGAPHQIRSSGTPSIVTSPDAAYSSPVQQPPTQTYSALGLLHEFGYSFNNAHHYHRGNQKPAGIIDIANERVQDNAIHSSGMFGAVPLNPASVGGESLPHPPVSVNCPKKFWEYSQLTGKSSNVPDPSTGGSSKATSIQRSHNSPTAHSTTKKRKRVATMAQRRAANIRERRRMFNLNEAFDKLRRKVPTFAYEKRLSRIETLKLAITYIAFMDDVLRTEKLRVVYGAGEGPVAAANSTTVENYRVENW